MQQGRGWVRAAGGRAPLRPACHGRGTHPSAAAPAGTSSPPASAARGSCRRRPPARHTAPRAPAPCPWLRRAGPDLRQGVGARVEQGRRLAGLAARRNTAACRRRRRCVPVLRARWAIEGLREATAVAGRASSCSRFRDSRPPLAAASLTSAASTCSCRGTDAASSEARRGRPQLGLHSGQPGDGSEGGSGLGGGGGGGAAATWRSLIACWRSIISI